MSSKKGFEGTTKTPRANDAREKTQRRKPWAPASSLDAPPAPEGYKHRWIRAEARGFQDTKNVSARLREGYELVRRVTLIMSTAMYLYFYVLDMKKAAITTPLSRTSFRATSSSASEGCRLSDVQ